MKNLMKGCLLVAGLLSAHAAFAVCEYDDHVSVCATKSGTSATGSLIPSRRVANAQVKLWECKKAHKTGCFLAQASPVRTLENDGRKLLTPQHLMVTGYCYYATAYENGKKIVWTRDDLGEVCR